MALICSIAIAGTTVDASGTITVGGTSQLAVVATGVNKPRVFLMIQNKEATDHIYVNFTAAASSSVAGSIDLAPGAVLWMDQFVTDEAVNIVGPTTGDKFTCKYR